MTNHWLRDQIARVEDLLRQEAQELSLRLLPDLEKLDHAYQCTGLDFLKPAALEMLARERQQLEQRRAQLENDPDFHVPVSDSQRLAAAELRRIREHQAALVPLIRICHGHPRFAELLRNGYGTGRYATPFWRLSFYADRKAAAELCQRASKKNFAALLRDYHSANDSYDVLHERLEDIKERPLSPRQQWEQLGRRLQGLEQVHLSTAQSRIQLALLKGGPCWAALKRAPLEPEMARMVEATGLLKDQLDQLRQQRADAARG
ncbi:hypothetical protein IV102_19305 [bacterium]|nr:hypothetical protein [bacterium]